MLPPGVRTFLILSTYPPPSPMLLRKRKCWQNHTFTDKKINCNILLHFPHIFSKTVSYGYFFCEGLYVKRVEGWYGHCEKQDSITESQLRYYMAIVLCMVFSIEQPSLVIVFSTEQTSFVITEQRGETRREASGRSTQRASCYSHMHSKLPKSLHCVVGEPKSSTKPYHTRDIPNCAPHGKQNLPQAYSIQLRQGYCKINFFAKIFSTPPHLLSALNVTLGIPTPPSISSDVLHTQRTSVSRSCG